MTLRAIEYDVNRVTVGRASVRGSILRTQFRNADACQKGQSGPDWHRFPSRGISLAEAGLRRHVRQMSATKNVGHGREGADHDRHEEARDEKREQRRPLPGLQVR